MAKKTHVKVRLVPESKPNSPFFYYVKKPAGGEKAKVKLKAKKYNPATRKHETFVEKKLPPHSKQLFLFKISSFIINIKKDDIKVIVVEALSSILPGFNEKLIQFAQRKLEKISNLVKEIKKLGQYGKKNSC